MGNMSKLRSPLEPHTRTLIDTRLMNLGWILNQRDPRCNVFQEQAKTTKQNKLFKGNRPDYVLYETGTDKPIAIIEAKKPGVSINKYLQKVVKAYAIPIQAPLVFIFNETFVVAHHVNQNCPLKIDGEEIQDLIDESTALRFVNDGAEILSLPEGVNFTRDELLRIFQKVNNTLRKDGLRDGYERFSAFAEILFLKLIDEYDRLDEHIGTGNKRFASRFLWRNFSKKFKNDDVALLDFISNSVWSELQRKFGEIFNSNFSIKKPKTLRDIVDLISPINLIATDTDVKGDAFEFFLKTVTNGNKDLGEYFTPRHITRTMVKMVKPLHGETIYDPFCGTGGFLLEAFKHLSLRTDVKNESMIKWLREDALHGRELTSTARITKMSMILFGDGHTNIHEIDSLENPVKEKYNIVLSNIPYSQKTDFGSLYPIPTQNGDSVCMQHIWNSLKPGGRAAVIVPETFLYESGDIGMTREMIVQQSKKFSVVSLPRGVFMPYTPTKTNILYFEKKDEGDKQFKKTSFFVIHNDGFELNTKRKPVKGDSDIRRLLDEFDNGSPRTIKAMINTINRTQLISSGNYNLRPFYYMEDVPDVTGDMISLSEDILQEQLKKVNPTSKPDDIWNIIQVSQKGIFLDSLIKGYEATQAYKIVKTGDIVYNPYRVNIGSIGVVPPPLDNSLTSPAYVVVRVKDKRYSPSYIVSILKQPRYLKVIMNYSLSSSRASLPFDELIRIKIPKPTQYDVEKLKKLERELEIQARKEADLMDKINGYTSSRLCKERAGGGGGGNTQ